LGCTTDPAFLGFATPLLEFLPAFWVPFTPFFFTRVITQTFLLPYAQSALSLFPRPPGFFPPPLIDGVNKPMVLSLWYWSHRSSCFLLHVLTPKLGHLPGPGSLPPRTPFLVTGILSEVFSVHGPNKFRHCAQLFPEASVRFPFPPFHNVVVFFG